ncbi:inositol 3-kinase isoform X2 [Abrus precatorius]|uniref:Inositol 3-kinase isoform X2 n=1 Tax=Abrus precatorius TaxID=3816 RepID=A0A8B8JMF0_ABRPR|nr:inositol 3-kinase isoform X2 [Abrus precatorius]
MVTDSIPIPRRGLIVGNYCHDVLHRDGIIVAETLGGAASFISAVLDALSLPFHTLSKVGPEFAYATVTSNHPPLVVPTSPTTLFHAHFDSANPDRTLNRVRACEPIRPMDLPNETRFGFGMAVGVGGEILPETLEKMVEICEQVFVDVQGLIRTFDGEDGSVKHVRLKESGFFHLLPRIGFLKASADEASFLDLDEVRRWCCVVVTHGKDGCEVFCKDGAFRVAPFEADQVDPTGAGDCFLGGFAAGIVRGLAVPDAALVGNFFGSLAVAQVGPPKLDVNLFQDEMHKRKVQDDPCLERREEWPGFQKPPDEDQFYASLVAVKGIIMCEIQESEWNLLSSPKVLEQNNVKARLSLNSVHEESIPSVDRKP